MRRKTQNMQAIDEFIGHKIRWFRIQRGLSQDQLAKRLGISYQQLHKYENGSSSAFASRLADIATVLGVSVSALFEGLEEADTSTWQLTENCREKRLLIKYCNQIHDPNHQHILQMLISGLSKHSSSE